MERVRMEIDEMHCGHCVADVTRAVETRTGVIPESVRVRSAVVASDAGRIAISSILAAVTGAGFPARLSVESA